MIRRLTEADCAAAYSFLEREPEFNLYQLGNLESVGLGSSRCEFWGDFQTNNDVLRAILNRYQNGWIAFGTRNADWAGLGNILDHHPVVAARLQDNPAGIPSFVPFLHKYQVQKSSIQAFMRLAPEHYRPRAAPAGITIRQANLNDLAALVAFYRDAGSMSRTPAAIEHPLRHMQIWLAEVDGKIAGAALTNAETSARAMIGGVYTHPDYRNRQIATCVCSALCQSLLAAGRWPVLYWDTPAAGAVYRRLGFQEIGAWRSVWLTPR